MAFSLHVKRAGHLSSAGIWYLEGNLLSGVIQNGALAKVASGTREIRIQNIAMVDPFPADLTYKTLVIDEPPFPIEELQGVFLIGVEETANNTSELPAPSSMCE